MDEGWVAGILHLAFGAVGFACLAAATFALAAWARERQERAWMGLSRLAGTLVLLAFVTGGALASMTAGVALLWLAVVTGWAWLAAASVHLYRTVPHPDAHRRAPGDL